jgi:hypothetical protein
VAESRNVFVNPAVKNLPMTKEFSGKPGFTKEPAGRLGAPMPAVPRAGVCVLLIALATHAEAQKVRETAVMAERSELEAPIFQSTVVPLGARLRWTPSSEVTAWMPAGAPRGKPMSHAQGARVTATRRGAGRSILGAVVGAAGGLFAGGFAGAAIEGDRCHCDDQGLTGALIGAPVGAVLGGIAGGMWLF